MNKTFKEVLNLNPTPGVGHPEYQDKVKSHSYRYFIPSWLKSCDKDGEWFSHKKIIKILNNIGVSAQLYYDIVILGLTSESDRPKCHLDECDCSKFYNLNQGYQLYCSKSHQVKDKNRNIKDSTREKLRISGYNHKVPDNMRYYLSNLVRSNPSIKKKQMDNKLASIIRRKISLGILDKDGNPLPKKKLPRKPVSDEFRKRCSERMKKFFKEHPEKIHVNGFRRFNNKTGYEFSKKANRNIRYLSSWELDFIRFIDRSDEVVKILDIPPIEYYNEEKSKISLYFADFNLVLNNGMKVIIEIKPKNLINNKIVVDKRNAAIEYCKNNGFYYITLTELELFDSKRIRNNSRFNNNLKLIDCISSQYTI